MRIDVAPTPFQKAADDLIRTSSEYYDSGDYIYSFTSSTIARIPYLIDAIANAILIPIALIGMVFSIPQAIYLWEIQPPLLIFSFGLLTSKIHRLCTSLLGSLLWPSAAGFFADRNILPYVIGLIFTGFATSALLNHSSSPINNFEGIDF